VTFPLRCNQADSLIWGLLAYNERDGGSGPLSLAASRARRGSGPVMPAEVRDALDPSLEGSIRRGGPRFGGSPGQSHPRRRVRRALSPPGASWMVFLFLKQPSQPQEG